MYDKAKLAAALQSCCNTNEILYDEPLASHTTFRIGGPCDFFVSPGSTEGVQRVLQQAQACDAPVHILGCGSNVLVADEGIAGLVLHMGGSLSSLYVEGERMVVQAGATNEAVAAAAQRAGLSGYEFASGIPGSIGGAALMNAGAYEGEFKDVCAWVECVDDAGNVVRVGADDADLSYRHSMMMDKGWVVGRVCIELHAGDRDAIQAKMDGLAERRSSKQPLEWPSAGSTFKRPEGHFAGKLIQDAGMQGHTCGGASVSTKHAGFVVSDGNATAADVLQVIRDVQQAVEQSSGIVLEPEVRMWF